MSFTNSGQSVIIQRSFRKQCEVLTRVNCSVLSGGDKKDLIIIRVLYNLGLFSINESIIHKSVLNSVLTQTITKQLFLVAVLITRVCCFNFVSF